MARTSMDFPYLFIDLRWKKKVFLIFFFKNVKKNIKKIFILFFYLFIKKYFKLRFYSWMRSVYCVSLFENSVQLYCSCHFHSKIWPCWAHHLMLHVTNYKVFLVAKWQKVAGRFMLNLSGSHIWWFLTCACENAALYLDLIKRLFTGFSNITMDGHILSVKGWTETQPFCLAVCNISGIHALECKACIWVSHKAIDWFLCFS